MRAEQMGNRKRGKGMPGEKKASSRLRFEVSLPVMILEDGSGFTAYTPALDLCTCGDTKEDAQKMFGEAVAVFLKELVNMGTLEEVLRECGWKKVAKPTPHWIPPRVVEHTEQTVSIPVGA
jgi:hypothetical protein